MLHYDFDWDLSANGIVLDPELNIDKLGWKGGDYFKLVNVDGKVMLRRIDPLEKFLKDGKGNV